MSLNTGKWLSGMNCVGYTPQEAQVKLSQNVLKKQLVRDRVLKNFWIGKFDEDNRRVQKEQDVTDRRNEILLKSKFDEDNRRVCRRSRTLQTGETRFF